LPNLNSVLGLSITTVNVNQNQSTINVSLQGIVLASSQIFYDQFVPCPTTGFVVPSIPGGSAFDVYVRNLSLTNVLNVTLTPTGGSAFTVALNFATSSSTTGGIFMVWGTTQAVGGFSALTLTGVGATVPAELYLAS
jgi:hypothetical protein